jgi:hypothetical protein
VKIVSLLLFLAVQDGFVTMIFAYLLVLLENNLDARLMTLASVDHVFKVDANVKILFHA